MRGRTCSRNGSPVLGDSGIPCERSGGGDLRLSIALGIPSKLFPLIISRPLSGAAANASFASLASDCGANSFEVFAAAVIMGSSDTLVYVLFVYFSQTRVKKTLYAFPAAAAVAVFSLFVSLFFARLFFA